MKAHLLFLSLLVGTSTRAGAEERPSVKVLAVKLTELFDTFFYPAVLEAREESEVIAEIDGIVKETKIKIGQRVESNSTLFILRQSKPDYAFAPFVVKSPITGTIAKILKKVGSTVKVGEALVHIINHDDLAIKIEVPEAEVNLLKAGLSGEIQFKNSDAPMPILISGLSPILSSKTGTSNCELIWDERSPWKQDKLQLRKKFLPGMVGRVSFKLNSRKAISIPKSAIIFEKQNYLVRVVQGEKVFRKLIRLGKEYPDQVEVLSGLTENELVVTTRSKYLKEGELVKIDDNKGN